MIIGHEFLWNEFKIKPKIAWQIDSFGHSSAMTQMYIEMGYEALFFARMPENLKQKF